MAMLRFLMRKMWNTRLLTLSTFLGLLLAVSFTSSIPMYSDGALKRVVIKTLAEKSDNMPAGSLLLRYQPVGSDKPTLAALNDVDQYIREQVPKDIRYPDDVYVNNMAIRGAQVSLVDAPKNDSGKRRQMTLSTMNDLWAHTEVSYGTKYSEVVRNGVVEAVVMEEAMFRNDLHIGDILNYPLASGSKKLSMKVKIVGAFKPLIEAEPYWYQGMESLFNSIIISDKVFKSELLEKNKVPLNLSTWYYAFDLKEIKTSRISSLENTLERLDINLDQKLKNTKVDTSFLDMLGEFKRQSTQLQILLFTLAAPMIAMVFYYIVMNARQSLDRQRTDIAVIRSRGGSTRQIIWVYMLEGLILGGIALIIGPLIGWFLAKSIGSSSGFLTFVDRKSIPVGFSQEAFIYSVIAVFIAIAAQVIPAVVYAKSSIVNYKQQQARADRKPWWMRWYLDVALILLSGYGWYMFQQNQFIAQQTGLASDELQVQWVLFFVPALSIFALGLFFLRIFPWMLKLLGWIGRSLLPVSIYLTLTQLSRSAKAYYPLMLLLIMTLGLGVYNASAARTIDLNSTERMLYQYGTDVVMQPVWEGVTDDLPSAPTPTPKPGSGSGGGGSGGGTGGQQPPAKIRYIEPPFGAFEELNGVEAAARVLQTKGNVIVSGKSLGQGSVMGIDNDKFAKVAWFRNDLYPAHPFKYLNLMGSYEQSVIISTSFAERYQLKAGDLITIVLSQVPVEFVIVGTLPYWPTQYPDKQPFFITNLDYIYDQVPLIPYDIWLKMKDGAPVQPLVADLASKDIELVGVKDVRSELVKLNKHPTHGGVFGILSLGFLVSILISLIGYVLYWFFNLSSRIVQFGVLRAMGLKRKQLTVMLLVEQALTGGLSIAIGIGVGKLASYLFLPFLQTSDNVQTQVPPFHVVFQASDTYQLYFIVMVMMLLGAGFLFFHIRRLRVHQAIKLGEER
ncbi:ABC transporter permease [Paenibacillus psychroresistens]|uniref:ABC transporter permease n=1 Tax=Paenibacillus psychroresistens TaxID=1778678 RepID=A0A6B8RVI4_9BACL|nr:ABC transporter permease [Paenibacillus psychroresistens]QGQ99443.1 ABC transporter permease [Paenibacillus psychroresistens]